MSFSPEKPMRIGALLSGGGSNLPSIFDDIARDDCPYEVVVCISNRPGAPGLDKARAANVPAVTIDHKEYETREAFEAEVQKALEEHKVDLVITPGFMRILTNSFVEKWPERIINIHPTLLPSFPGLKPHHQALDAGVKISGCTVHFAVPDVDAGPIIGQAAVPVLDDDTPETLAARVMQAELKLFPHCLRLVAEGRVSIANGRTLVDARPSDFEVICPAD
jgi:phosphoribosylglycinamide formyltransferase-1